MFTVRSRARQRVRAGELSFGSEKEVDVDASGTTEVSLDAGKPEGVPVNTPISACAPRLLNIDITNA